MNKIYLGSTNPVKISSVEKVFKPHGYLVVGVDVDSNVSKQPLNDHETILGAINRAKALPSDGLRIGLEAGVEVVNDLLFLTNWGVLIDQFDQIYYASGVRILLPEVIKEAIFNQGMELSEAMEIYFKQLQIKYRNGAIGYFTNNQMVREDIYYQINNLLYGQLLKAQNDCK